MVRFDAHCSMNVSLGLHGKGGQPQQPCQLTLAYNDEHSRHSVPSVPSFFTRRCIFLQRK